jgi:hypothetical protein
VRFSFVWPGTPTSLPSPLSAANRRDLRALLHPPAQLLDPLQAGCLRFLSNPVSGRCRSLSSVARGWPQPIRAAWSQVQGYRLMLATDLNRLAESAEQA